MALLKVVLTSVSLVVVSFVKLLQLQNFVRETSRSLIQEQRAWESNGNSCTMTMHKVITFGVKWCVTANIHLRALGITAEYVRFL